MKYSLTFLPVVYFDLNEAVDYYGKISEQLSDEFLSEVDESLDFILTHPLHYQKVYKLNRKCNIYRFPYGIVYKVQDSEIIIKAIIHLKRDPLVWRSRK